MVNTPFSTATQTYPGLAVKKDRGYKWQGNRFWIGQAANMIQLPAPVPGYTQPPTRGETVHSLIGGGSSVTLFPFKKRTWTLTWPMLINRDWQVVNGFYMRLFGSGPWCFPDPADINYLPTGASLCGALNAVAEGWAVTAGTIAYDATQTAAEIPSGVLRWTGAGNGSQAGIGTLLTGALTADTALGLPYISAFPVSASVYVAHASGTSSACAQLLGINAAGAIVATINGSTTVLTTTPQQLTVSTAAASGSTAVYWMLAVKSLTAAAPDALISCPQLEYNAAPSAWGAGAGCSRVVCSAMTADVPDGFGSRNVTMTLVQA